MIFARALSVVLAVLFAAAPIFSAVTADSGHGSVAVSYTVQYNTVLDYLYSTGAPAYGSIGGEWKVLALARSGRLQADSSYFETYYSQIDRIVRTNGSPTLGSVSTDNSRVIIALTSIGRDAREVGDYDLTAPLSNFEFDVHQGINGAIFTLLALSSKSMYGMNSIKNRCVDYILEREISGGGWAMFGSNADPDITAMAMTALAPYSSARAAINRGVNKLSSMQNSNGSFSSYGSPNAESCAWVIVALSALNIDAGSDSRFVKHGKSVVDALLSFFVSPGFSHTIGGEINGMATEQAAYSLCAYDRYRRGAYALFNMNDVPMYSPGAVIPPITIAPGDPVTPTPSPSPTPTPRPTNSPTPSPSPTPTPKPTNTPTPSPTNSPTPTPSPTPRPTNTPTPRPTNTPTPSPTPYYAPSPTPTSTPTSIPTDVPSDAPVDPNETPIASDEPTDLPDASDDPIDTEQPDSSEDPEDSAEPSDTPEASQTPEPEETATVPPVEPTPADTSDPTAIPELTFDPINITGGDWNGHNSKRRESLKWIIPAGIGGIVAVSCLFLFIASRKRQ